MSVAIATMFAAAAVHRAEATGGNDGDSGSEGGRQPRRPLPKVEASETSSSSEEEEDEEKPANGATKKKPFRSQGEQFLHPIISHSLSPPPT